jgi:serine/threonine-protein kinase
MSSNVFDPGADELSRACRIDAACDRFETAWKTCNQPRIEEYLDEIAAPERLVLARELILLDVHYRRLAGQTCLVNEYDSRFPDLDPTWLASVIPARTGGSSTPTAPHPPDANAGSITNNGQTISPLATDSLQSFGDYEIRGVIGESGMGVVYKAWQRSLNRFVALKTIRHGRGLSRSAVERFRAEAEMAAHLDHPNIVPIYEVSEHEGQPYFTMKLIEGVDLARLPSGFTEDQRAVARLVATAARAVHHAHQRGILHRDLKPANILLEWPAGPVHPPVPHVADFGLAKRLDVDMHLSLEDGLVGTPVYMAPEQALRKSDLTTAVDVHGLGAVLYFLLTGQPPFKAETILETVQQVIEREPARPRSLKPGVDRDLEIICLRCLEKRPQDRLRSAEEVAEELERWLAGKPIRSRSSSTPEKILKWVRRRPAVAALLVVSALAMLALVGVGVGLWYSAQLQTAYEGLVEVRENLAITNGELETAIEQKGVVNSQLESALKDVRLEKNEVEKQRQALEKANYEKDVAYKKLDDATRDIRREKAEVEKQRQLARRFLYVSQINLADRAHKEGKPGLALQLLESVRPKDIGEEDMRGPEWFHLWNVCRGYAFALHGHMATITAMEFSPDGRWLAAGAEDGRIIVWDTLQTRVHQTFAGQGKSISALQFTKDSKIVVGRTDQGSIGAWDVTLGRELTVAPKLQSEAARAQSQLTNLEQVRSCFVRLLPETDRAVICMAFTSNNRTALAGFGPDPKEINPRIKNPGVDGYLVVYEVGQKSEKIRLRLPVPVSSVALSDSGGHIAWAGEDRIIHLRDLEQGKDGQSLAFNSTARLLAFSRDRRLLASAHADHTIRVWELEPRQMELVLNTQDEQQANNVVFNPKLGQIAAGCRGTTEIWEIPSGKQLLNWAEIQAGSNGGFKRVAYSADGRWLSDGTRVIDVGTGEELSHLNLPNIKAFGTAFSPNGKLVATAASNAAGTSGSVFVCETATGHLLLDLKAPLDWPVCVAFSPDGKLLASGSATQSFVPGGIRVWEVATGLEIHTHLPRLLNTFSVAFSPDGKWLATAHGTSDDGPRPFPGEIKIWDTQSWAEVMSLEGHTSCVWWLSFSPDGKRLASAAGMHSRAEKTPGEIKIWDLTLGQELLTLKGHTGCVRGVSFSPNGKVLASGSADGTIRFWGDLASLKP